MKKIIISLTLIICVSMQVTGCSKQKTNNSINENQKIETTVKNTNPSSGSTSVNGDAKITVTNFNLPNQILVYKNGKEKKILEDDKKYAEILKLSDNRIGNKVSPLLLFISKQSIEKLKNTEIVIEFVYSEQQKKISNLEQEYTELVFPLTGDYMGYCIFESGNDNYSGPIKILSSPYSDSLLNLLK